LRRVAGRAPGVSRRLDRVRFAADRSGVTAVEYGIVATFLCLSLLGIFTRFGSVLLTMFSGVTTSI
jgi:Flp pilus assembly pilin Flp